MIEIVQQAPDSLPDAANLLERITAMETEVRALGISAESLDELVHDALSLDASSINNEGMESQLRFTAAAGGIEAMKAHLRGLDVDIDLAPYVQSDSFEALAGVLAAQGVTEEDLDDLVHDFFGEGASTTNNQGLTAQLQTLVQCYGLRGARDIIIKRFGASSAPRAR